MRTHAGHESCRGSDGKLVVGGEPAVFQWCLALAWGTDSHGDGAVSLRSNCARLSLGAIQPHALWLNTAVSGVGSGPWDSDRRGRMLVTKYVEATIVS